MAHLREAREERKEKSKKVFLTPLIRSGRAPRDYFEELLSFAGVSIGGSRPWDMHVNDPGLFDRVVAKGSLALGEGYMEGQWECDSLDGLFHRVLSARLDERVGKSFRELWMLIRSLATNAQKGRRAYKVGEYHYDIGNDFYMGMLDVRLAYSCGYWSDAESLDASQEAKLDLICRKIDLKPGDKVLDIGCGWGSFAGYAAEHYGAKLVGITVSAEQAKYANERYKELPVEVRLQDYRHLAERFDHIVSVGMFEHVGHKNYRTYMELAERCLNDEGNFLLHTIGRNVSSKSVDPWIEKYIFPNSQLPSPAQITAAVEGLFSIRDWHSFGRDYDPTLMAWHKNFEWNWDDIKGGLDQRFKRMWRYYLLSCAGSFRADDNQLWQILLSKPRKGGEHKNVR